MVDISVPCTMQLGRHKQVRNNTKGTQRINKTIAILLKACAEVETKHKQKVAVETKEKERLGVLAGLNSCVPSLSTCSSGSEYQQSDPSYYHLAFLQTLGKSSSFRQDIGSVDPERKDAQLPQCMAQSNPLLCTIPSLPQSVNKLIENELEEAKASLHLTLPPRCYFNVIKEDPQKRVSTELEKFSTSVLDEKEDDSSLSKKKDFCTNAYKRRNVYKSIIRHMHSFLTKNKPAIISMLSKEGFSITEIEHSFLKIIHWNELEKHPGTSKKSQVTIEEILESKSIPTYVLRETLHAMMQNWKKAKTGKISRDNLEVYNEVCSKYYQRTVEILSQQAQCISFKL